MNANPAFLLDVSRLVSRIGTGPLTGIDRVEAAWLAHMADRPHLLLCRVTRGQVIGYEGMIGFSMGCHLHFETYVNGDPVNPRGWL